MAYLIKNIQSYWVNNYLGSSSISFLNAFNNTISAKNTFEIVAQVCNDLKMAMKSFCRLISCFLCRLATVKNGQSKKSTFTLKNCFEWRKYCLILLKIQYKHFIIYLNITRLYNFSSRASVESLNFLHFNWFQLYSNQYQALQLYFIHNSYKQSWRLLSFKIKSLLFKLLVIEGA